MQWTDQDAPLSCKRDTDAPLSPKLDTEPLATETAVKSLTPPPRSGLQPWDHASHKLSDAQKVWLRRELVLGEKTQETLAKMLAIDPGLISYYKRRWAIPPIEFLKLSSTDLTEDWLTASRVASMRGDHHPARDALLHAKLIEPLETEKQSPVTVNIGIINSPNETGLQSAIKERINSGEFTDYSEVSQK